MRIGESASQAKHSHPLFGRKRYFAHICAPSMGKPADFSTIVSSAMRRRGYGRQLSGFAKPELDGIPSIFAVPASRRSSTVCSSRAAFAVGSQT
jgi:hypothetical protein